MAIIQQLNIPTRAVGTPDPSGDINAIILKVNELVASYNNENSGGYDPSNITPPAPTNTIVDDDADTFNWTNAVGYTTADHETTVDRGVTWQPAVKPLMIGDVVKVQDDVQVRVKAATGRNASVPLGNLTPFNKKPVQGLPTITGINPTSAGINESVVITGTNFVNVTSVAFTGAVGITYTVNSPTQITVTIPAGSTQGNNTLTVTTSAGAANYPITVLPPVNTNPQLLKNPDFNDPIVTNPANGWQNYNNNGAWVIANGKATSGSGDIVLLSQTLANLEVNAFYELSAVFTNNTTDDAQIDIVGSPNFLTVQDEFNPYIGTYLKKSHPKRLFKATGPGGNLWLWLKSGSAQLESVSLKKQMV